MPHLNSLQTRLLTPEEESIGEPDDELDDLTPADLWFRDRRPAPVGDPRS